MLPVIAAVNKTGLPLAAFLIKTARADPDPFVQLAVSEVPTTLLKPTFVDCVPGAAINSRIQRQRCSIFNVAVQPGAGGTACRISTGEPVPFLYRTTKRKKPR